MSSSGSRHVTVAMLCGIMAFGLLLRLYGLERRSLWFDEAFSWRLIQFPFFEMLCRAECDNHPPFYFAVLQGWAMAFGDSAPALRSLSVILGVATIPGTYLFAAKAFPSRHMATCSVAMEPARRTGLIAVLLVATSGLQVRYSWEVRMYALATALSVFSSWALVCALRPGGRRGWWCVYGTLAVLLTYTHYYGVFTLAMHGAFLSVHFLGEARWSVVGIFRTKGVRSAAVTGWVACMAWLPWLPVFLQQKAHIREEGWASSVDVWVIAKLLYQMVIVPEEVPNPPRSWQLVALAVWSGIVGLLCCIARSREWLVLSLSAGPIMLCWLTSLCDVCVCSLRYCVMAHLFILIGLAFLIERISMRGARPIAVVVLLGIFIAADADFFESMGLERKAGPRGAAAVLSQQRQPGEPVIDSMPFFLFSLVYYSRKREGVFLYTDGNRMPSYYGTAAMKAEDLITPEGMRGLRYRRVWVVNMAGGRLGIQSVPAPAEWRELKRWMCWDVFDHGLLILIEYETDYKQCAHIAGMPTNRCMKE